MALRAGEVVYQEVALDVVVALPHALALEAPAQAAPPAPPLSFALEDSATWLAAVPTGFTPASFAGGQPNVSLAWGVRAGPCADAAGLWAWPATAPAVHLVPGPGVAARPGHGHCQWQVHWHPSQVTPDYNRIIARPPM